MMIVKECGNACGQTRYYLTILEWNQGKPFNQGSWWPGQE